MGGAPLSTWPWENFGIFKVNNISSLCDHESSFLSYDSNFLVVLTSTIYMILNLNCFFFLLYG